MTCRKRKAQIDLLNASGDMHIVRIERAWLARALRRPIYNGSIATGEIDAR